MKENQATLLPDYIIVIAESPNGSLEMHGNNLIFSREFMRNVTKNAFYNEF